MDLSETFTKPLKDFAKNSIRLVKRCSKPDIKGKQKVHRSVCVCVCGEREKEREREEEEEALSFPRSFARSFGSQGGSVCACACSS